jgi:RNA polymerase sigma factor (TIGR02999 family)
MPEVYDELRRLAQHYMGRRVQPNQTLQPTALVHEAFLKLVDHQSINVNGRTHFFALAANAMRFVLADQARRRHSLKRGGFHNQVPLHSGLFKKDTSSGFDAVALHEALDRLAQTDERAARIIELRFFAGLNIEQTAEAVGVSPGTVKNEWRWARAWLLNELSSDTDRTDTDAQSPNEPPDE